jgi:hypothetical protein
VNRSMSPGDGRHRSSDSRRAPGPAGPVPCAGRLGGRATDHRTGNGTKKVGKARLGRSRTGQRGSPGCLTADRIDTLAVFTLGGRHLESLLLAQGPADEAADAVAYRLAHRCRPQNCFFKCLNSASIPYPHCHLSAQRWSSILRDPDQMQMDLKYGVRAAPILDHPPSLICGARAEAVA